MDLFHCIFLYVWWSVGHVLMSAVIAWWCQSGSSVSGWFFNTTTTSLWQYWAIQCWELPLNCLDFNQGWHNSQFFIWSCLLFCHFLRWKCFWKAVLRETWVTGSSQCWGIRFPYRMAWLGMIFLALQDLLCTAQKQITIALIIWANLKEETSCRKLESKLGAVSFSCR